MALAITLLSGCSQEVPNPGNETVANHELLARGDESRSIDFGSDSYNSLWDRADLAVSEARLWSPAGNNAVEFYLQIRQGAFSGEPSPEQEIAKKALEAALADFTPLLSLAIDEAIEGRQIQEASRLIRMLAAIDSQTPSLPRQIEQVRRAASPPKT